MADFFISYTSTDKDWAFWLAKVLKALDHTPHIHEWEVAGGDDIYAWMQRRHEAADRVLCVASEEYMLAPFSTLERNAAIWQAAAKRPGFVLFVVVKPCHVPTLIDHIRRCELFGLPEDAARIRFRDFVTKPVEPETVTFPGKVFAVSNIPIRVPEHFMGRDESLAAITAALMSHQGRAAITALHGLRGVGKTTLAAAYAERHRSNYRAIWWIRAQSESSIRADLIAFGVRLGWVNRDEKDEPALAAVRERLEHESEGILLIYDNALNVSQLTPYLPRSAQVLVTSNAHDWRGVAQPVEIKVWPKAVGADFLIGRTGRVAERDAAEALSDALGGLPLAHEMAAAYCERLEVSLADYGRRFAARPVELLEDERYAPAGYGLTVAKTFNLAIDAAAREHPAAEPLTAHLALLAAEPIPLFLLREGRKAFGEPLATLLAGDGLDQAIAALRAFALVDRETITDERDRAVTTEALRLHRLVREIAAARLPIDTRDKVRETLLLLLATTFSEDVRNKSQNWPQARRLDALILALIGGGIEVPKGAEKPFRLLLNNLGAYYRKALAADTQARPLLERALTLTEEAFGPIAAEVADAITPLAVVLQNIGDVSGAQGLFERALSIRQNVFGNEHPDTAQTLNHLARILRMQGNLPEARLLAEQALGIRERTLGLDHQDTADSASNLAVVLQMQGDLDGAVAQLYRALEIFEKELGLDAPVTNRCAYSLAKTLLPLNRPEEAAGLAERALAAHEAKLKAQHHWRLDSARFTAEVYDALGRVEEALALRQRYGFS